MATAGGAVFDPLSILRTALSLPADSDEQGKVLAELKDMLEAAPQTVPVLCTSLIPGVVNQADSLFKQWLFELPHRKDWPAGMLALTARLPRVRLLPS